MINIVYCPDHAGGEVVAAGVCYLPTIHTHADLTDHICRVLLNVNEAYAPDADAWFATLKTTYGGSFDLT